MGRNTVLIVADRHPNPDLNTQFLRQSDVKVVTCRPGRDTLDVVQRERPQLIIDDLSCSADHDTDVCRSIRQDPAAGRIPMIVVSSPERLGEARDVGADELLCKPIIPGVFYETVRQYVPLPQRLQYRHAVNLRFLFEWSGRTVQAFSRDISLSGAFLRTDRTIDPGTHLALCFALPGDIESVRCGGRVRRETTGAVRLRDRGLGIEFEGIADRDLERLERYITRNEYRPGLFR